MKKYPLCVCVCVCNSKPSLVSLFVYNTKYCQGIVLNEIMYVKVFGKNTPQKNRKQKAKEKKNSTTLSRDTDTFNIMHAKSIKIISPSCVLAKVLDYDPEVSKFELQSRYHVHFRTNTLSKSMTLLIPAPAKGLIEPLLFFY